MKKQEVIDKAVAAHVTTYGVEPETVAYAPGRVEILGNHTDNNEGTTFSCAINLGHCFCISNSEEKGVHLYAADLDETASFDPADEKPLDKSLQWANYVKGVIHILRSYDVEMDGVSCTFLGSIPMGAGLSSSAALEVATAYAVLAHTGRSLDPIDVAKVGQKAEHDFAGCSCGLLDQLSSLFGVEQGLIHSDFRTLKTESVSLPEDIVFLMVNPGVQHKLAESPYNARRASCERAAAQLDALVGYPVNVLRDIPFEDFDRLKERIEAEGAQRASHVVGEIKRVETGVRLLEAGRVTDFGQLLFASHESSRTAFENSCPALDVVVEAARDAGALGARLSGGGWGGSCVAMVRKDAVEFVCERIAALCREQGLDPEVEVVLPSAGAAVVA